MCTAGVLPPSATFLKSVNIMGIVVTVAIVLVLDLVIAAVVKALFHGSLRVDEADEALGLDAVSYTHLTKPRRSRTTCWERFLLMVEHLSQ